MITYIAGVGSWCYEFFQIQSHLGYFLGGLCVLRSNSSSATEAGLGAVPSMNYTPICSVRHALWQTGLYTRAHLRQLACDCTLTEPAHAATSDVGSFVSGYKHDQHHSVSERIHVSMDTVLELCNATGCVLHHGHASCQVLQRWRPQNWRPGLAQRTSSA
jgi:hypothetical protein